MRLIAFLSLALAPTAAALAAPPAPTRIAWDRSSAEFTATMTPTGIVSIEGRYLDTGGRFAYLVDQEGRVSGHIDGTEVSFSVGKAKRDRLVAQLSREAETDRPATIASASPETH
ncbi:MAG: hypothetical protein JWO25_1437 [Alphaproteobacteria bacterium]|nr:hypothetical protein [Alphaproteobacteria bacterium]